MTDQAIVCYPGETATATEVVALADEYRFAAQLLVQNGRPKQPRSRAPFRMVAIHAVELYLNAFLLQSGHSAGQVRGLQHNLAARADLAVDRGLVLRKRTSDRGIAVMDSRERNLSNQKTFLVTITRLRDHLTLVVDSSDKLGAAVARNKGEKASALEVTAQLTPTEKKIGELDQLKPEEANKAEKELARSKSKTLDFGI
ncbi:hypothetical protein [Qipengyuania flava]|uniref:hypothetical protein n=1 Tax=Qipengyuania flava TaxID=192812 RepID=UPI001CD47368|nr:hypothetical protein [Qipengyuania flava]MCA0890011.1 hypothetical protein [Qipengyuania flava]